MIKKTFTILAADGSIYQMIHEKPCFTVLSGRHTNILLNRDITAKLYLPFKLH